MARVQTFLRGNKFLELADDAYQIMSAKTPSLRFEKTVITYSTDACNVCLHSLPGTQLLAHVEMRTILSLLQLETKVST